MLEMLYTPKLLEKRPSLSFLVGFAYGIIGIGLAAVLFPKDPALVTVAFISLLLYPNIKSLMQKEESRLKRTKNAWFHWPMHKEILSRYLLMFLGVFLAYGLFSMSLPALATNKLFESQVEVLFGSVTGNAAMLNVTLFKHLFLHNIKIVALAFLTAFLIGDGAIFLLSWNASVWGTIFGTLASTAAFQGALNPLLIFVLILFIVLPHMLLEALSYIFAATAGGVTSRVLVKEKKKKWQLLRSCLLLIMISLGILAIGMFVEQYVLVNNELYRSIARLSGLI